jgi:hypothetical protein
LKGDAILRETTLIIPTPAPGGLRLPSKRNGLTNRLRNPLGSDAQRCGGKRRLRAVDVVIAILAERGYPALS